MSVHRPTAVYESAVPDRLVDRPDRAAGRGAGRRQENVDPPPALDHAFHTGSRLVPVEHAQRREASAQDVSIARYHLLEMKVAAGRLTAAAFCQQARTELQAMAAAEGDEPVKAEIGLRADKIDAMTISPDLCRLAID